MAFQEHWIIKTVHPVLRKVLLLSKIPMAHRLMNVVHRPCIGEFVCPNCAHLHMRSSGPSEFLLNVEAFFWVVISLEKRNFAIQV